MNQKGFAPIILVLGVVLLVFVGWSGYYLYTQNKIFFRVPKSEISYLTPTLSPNQISNWRVYSNDQYKYQFKYPADLYTICDYGKGPGLYEGKQDTKNDFCRGGGELQSYFSVEVNNTSNPSPTSKPNAKMHCFDDLIEEATIDGIPAKKITAINLNFDKECSFFSGISQNRVRIDLTKNENIYSIYGIKSDIFNKVLSTFKFTNQNQTTNLSSEATSLNVDLNVPGYVYKSIEPIDDIVYVGSIDQGYDKIYTFSNMKGYKYQSTDGVETKRPQDPTDYILGGLAIQKWDNRITLSNIQYDAVTADGVCGHHWGILGYKNNQMRIVVVDYNQNPCSDPEGTPFSNGVELGTTYKVWVSDIVNVDVINKNTKPLP